MSVVQTQPGWIERKLSLEARDPTPLSDTTNFWRGTSQAATKIGRARLPHQLMTRRA